MKTSDKRQIVKSINVKRKKGMLPPQVCTHCGMSLKDPSVPPEYEFAEELFTLALEVRHPVIGHQWQCPYCLLVI